MAHGDHHAGMALTEKLFRSIVSDCCESLQVPFQDETLDFEKPFARMSHLLDNLACRKGDV